MDGEKNECRIKIKNGCLFELKRMVSNRAHHLSQPSIRQHTDHSDATANISQISLILAAIHTFGSAQR